MRDPKYSFTNKMEEGRAGERIIAQLLDSREKEWRFTSREEQHMGDIMVAKNSVGFGIEVKYDKMARVTGNICFECYNSKGEPSGILSTEAYMIYYVIPNGRNRKGHEIIGFDANKLKLFIKENIDELRVVQGGDYNDYTMALVEKGRVISELAVEYIDEWV